jgi:G:T-mismatch repair DNA endonuclease (very short patch repair protein)
MYNKNSIALLDTFKNVQHALNGGEINICGAKVDWFNQETNTVYQFHVCFWHVCPECYNDDTINNINHETMGDLYEKTKERSKQIIDAGFNLIEMWECKWLKSKNYKSVTKDIVEPLNPRDAFYGGRTNASKLKAQNKILRYIDVCSLYPTVQYFDYYPVGHPKKIYKPEK